MREPLNTFYPLFTGIRLYEDFSFLRITDQKGADLPFSDLHYANAIFLFL